MPRRAVVLLGLAAAACGDNTSPVTAEVAAFPAAARPDLDVLLLIDSTNSADYERALADAMPALLARLAARPGGLPNLHIGVATSDLGTTGSLDPAHPAAPIGSPGGQGTCAGSGDAGALGVYGAPVTASFIVDVGSGSGRATNYTGELSDVLADVIRGVGVSGCGFEQTLGAVGVALDSPANAGFRRAGAGLAIVVLSDEDDCSVRDAAFFDPSETGTLGPLQSYRCTQHGVTCAEPLDATGAKTACAPATGDRYLADVTDLVAAVSAAEPDPLRRTVAAIVGPPTPFTVELRSPGNHAAPVLALGHSCHDVDSNGGLEVADPAVRTTAWAAALGGATYSICATDDAAPATAIAEQMLSVIDGDSCLHAPIPDGPLTCTAREDTTPIPACPAAGACLELVADATCATGLRAQIDRTTPASPDATVHVSCEIH